MNRTFVAGVVAGLALAVTAGIVISNDTQAAPFNPVITRHADAGEVMLAELRKVKPTDGGAVQFEVTVLAQVPEVRTLPDGGSRTALIVVGPNTCTPAGALRTALLNAFDGPFAVCARQGDDSEQ